MEKPKGFVDHSHLDHVYKLRKALYSLKQAPRAWYERFSQFLVENGYSKGGVNKTLLVKKLENNFVIIQIYVDDIIFCGVPQKMVDLSMEQMKKEFEMSMVGEWTYFMGVLDQTT